MKKLSTPIACAISFLLLLAGHHVTLLAQPAGWTQTLPITVNEVSGSTVTDYQLRITLDTQTPILAGQMNASGDDIRFGKDCAGNTLYNYWIESGINTPSTVIWVKVDTLFASGSRTFYMFYGNPSASTVSAVNTTFFGPQSSTDSVASGGAGGATNSQRGFRFSPNVDILVTHFGKREPNGTTRYVTLFEYVSQAIVTQTQVSGPAGQYSYGPLTNPVWLTQGTQYVLELYQGGSDGYYFGASSQIGQHLTYYDMRYCNSCTQNTFPTSTLTNYHYGYPDFWYYTRNMVTPAPTYTLGSQFTANAGPDASVCLGSSLLIGDTVTGGAAPYTYLWSPATDLLTTTQMQTIGTPGADITYTLTATDAGGCITRDTVSITVLPLPVVSAGADQQTCPGGSVTLNGSGADTYTWNNGVTDGVGFIPSATLDYIVTGTNTTTTCSNTDTVNVQVFPQPVIGISGDTVICAGDIVTLSGTGGVSYSWSTGDTATTINFMPSSGTSVTAVGVDVNSCSDTASVWVEVNPLPTVSFSLTEDTVCVNYGVQNLSGTPSGGTFSGNGVSGPAFSPSAAGAGLHEITYTYTDGNGCQNTDTRDILVLACTGLEDENTWAVTLMPNPTHGLVQITGNWTGPVRLEVVGIDGRTVLSRPETHAPVISLDLQGLTPGVYQVVLHSGQQTVIRPVVVMAP